jgi:hypothetical protein
MRQTPPQLLDKLQKSIQTIGTDANPKMQVSVARAKTAVIDSDYWTVETIRQTSGLGEVSVAPRRLKPFGRPNRIYEIHVHNGEVKTSIREYPDKLKEGWKHQFSLGSGSSVAIAFNGHWERYRKLWRLITEDKPWISWVDNAGDLWVQRWDDVSTKFQLSSGVSKVKMIRAWKNTVIQQNDQGVVVAYIKTNGKVYYRNFCQQEDYSEVWEFEREFTGFTGTAVNLNMFITNDYRMGVVIQSSTGQIHWLITHRNWGGMASPAESITAGITDIKFEVTPIAYHNAYSDENISAGITDIKFYVCPAGIVPVIVNTGRLDYADKKTITLTFNYDLECDLVALKTALTLKNVSNYTYVIDQVTQSGKVLTIQTVEEMPVGQNIIVTYNSVGSYYIAFRISPNCLYDYENSIDMTIVGIPPTGYANENLTVGITDISFVVSQVYYRTGHTDENLTAGITDISFVVTKVGSQPL